MNELTLTRSSLLGLFFLRVEIFGLFGVLPLTLRVFAASLLPLGRDLHPLLPVSICAVVFRKSRLKAHIHTTKPFVAH